MASDTKLKDTSKSNEVLLSVKDLKTYFYTEEGTVKAVDGVSFDINHDEILGLVGETGCGKSVSALSILKLIRHPGKILSGKIEFEGRDLVPLTEEQIRRIRGNDITMIFQDPLNSLNPVLKVGHQIAEVYLLHQIDILQEKLDYALTHNAENRLKLEKAKRTLDFEKKPLDIQKIFNTIGKNAAAITALRDKLAADESYQETQNARTELETILNKQVDSIHAIVDQMDMQSGEKEFFFSKIRLAPRKIRNMDIKELQREIKILLRELNPKDIIHIKEEQDGELEESERQKIIEELEKTQSQLMELSFALKSFWKEMGPYDKVIALSEKESKKRDAIKAELELVSHQSRMRTDRIIRYIKVVESNEAKIEQFTQDFEELISITDQAEFTQKRDKILSNIQNLQTIEKVNDLVREYNDIDHVEQNRDKFKHEIEELRMEEALKELSVKKSQTKVHYRKLKNEYEAVSKDYFEKQYEFQDSKGLKRIGFPINEEKYQKLKYILNELKKQQVSLYREIDGLKWDLKTEFETVHRIDESSFPPKVVEQIKSLQQKVDSVRINRDRKDELELQLSPIIQFTKDIENEIEELKVLVRRRIKLMDIALEESAKIIKSVGIADSRRIIDRYPHELSGGMRQRIMISMGLACQSKLLICDEPTTALDVTIQAQILELIRELKARLGNSVLFITHNLGVIYELCDKVAVMYAGNIVEFGDKNLIFNDPLHPYTHGLLGSIPRVKPEDRHKRLTIIPGMVPNLIFPLPGCRFNPRCSHAMNICRQIRPQLYKQENGNSVACWLFEKNHAKYQPGSFDKILENQKAEEIF
jgi:oligopeptide/dipeptide ABC transporter ATP-binding protein